MNQTSSQKPIVEKTAALSPHAAAVLKAGEQLLLESVQTGREFCKALVGISFSAVPIYVGLLSLIIPEKTLPTAILGKIWLLPITFFLLAAALAVAGYLPERKMLSIDLPKEVEESVASAIARRYWCGLAAFGFLVIGVASSVLILAKGST